MATDKFEASLKKLEEIVKHLETGSLTLSQWQQDSTNLGGDRHSIMVKPGAGFIWETWLARTTPHPLRASATSTIPNRMVKSPRSGPAWRRASDYARTG